MNFLAHAYLSFNEESILAGQMMGDFVRGKQQYAYSTAIQRGIALHRAIDSFTDAHVATQTARQLFKPSARLYAGVFVDVVYDYFLANNATVFATSAQLLQFSNQVYTQLDAFLPIMPQGFIHTFNYMRSQNWLYNYRLTVGIEKTFAGLSRRASFMTDYQPVFECFLNNQPTLNECYLHLWKDIQPMAIHYLTSD